ncbi:Ripening-related protein grip22 [Vitis vinifera]|uniref:Ripening-related protein grip22 n=1 Tax=Vitis vinifera TaxID=29760 RepID=A0A438IKY3_VITVI|nr:Ripening-related protein grip22 [Vitis vinifera]
MTVKVSSCIDGKCNDDPEVGTHINGGSSITPPPPPPGTCQPSGTLACNGGKPKNTYTCSPPVTSSTPAVLTNNNFEKEGTVEAHPLATTNTMTIQSAS